MVRKTLAIEREIDDTQSIQGMGISAKRKENQSSSSSRKKQKTSALYGFQGRGSDYQGQGRVGASSQTRHMTCYYCHQLGQMRQDCPHRQGSQNYGIAQSQSSVG